MEGCGKYRPQDQMELKFAKRWEPPMKPGPCGNPQLHQIKRRVNRGTPVSMTGESGETASGEDPNCRSFHGCRPAGDSAFCGSRSGAVGLPSSLLYRHSCAGLYLTAPHTPSGAPAKNSRGTPARSLQRRDQLDFGPAESVKQAHRQPTTTHTPPSNTHTLSSSQHHQTSRVGFIAIWESGQQQHPSEPYEIVLVMEIRENCGPAMKSNSHPRT
ncbi:hypothetical protein Bbelb_141040 [Branchiostoma belcheri]|nr:hypothetical protein Bbelb_141040 [Branchiostoma belcheri]